MSVVNLELEAPPGAPPLRPGDYDLLEMGESSLTKLERAQIRLVRASLRPGLLDAGIRTLQRTVGQWWIRAATAGLPPAGPRSRPPPPA